MSLKPGGNRHGPGLDDLPDLLTAKELEKLLKIDVKTIYSYVERGLIPYVRIQSNVRFIRQQILEWIAEQNYWPH
ncbi:MAG: helix-turn-helix domain-containing protein [Acidobacteria bacterium]|nr:helix-turn-helix domain-containing protein [Acidobacteriota bacterium]